MDQVSESVNELIEQFCKLPGIGKKSAERLAYHVLRIQKSEALALSAALESDCYNLTEQDKCSICTDLKRDRTRICVVEQPRDLMSIEATGAYRGLYHVLLGRIAPLEDVSPDQLTIDALVRRVKESEVNEVIMGTNPTLEGDGTALHMSNLLAELPVQVTRLARGITSGSVLEFANKEMLSDALSGRQPF